MAKEKIGINQNSVDSLLVNLEREKRALHESKINLANRQNQLKQLLAENEKLKQHLEQNRKILIKDAKLEAQQIVKEANKLVENTIAQIRKKQADKETVRQLRQTLKHSLQKNEVKPEPEPVVQIDHSAIQTGDWVQLINTQTTGQVLEINRDSLVLAFGDLRSVVKKNKVYKISNKQVKKAIKSSGIANRLNQAMSSFNPQLDLRGMRGEIAVQEIENCMDKAIMLGFPFIKIIHGKGYGILRKLVRDYLKGYKQVSKLEDEHADKGGDGITYVYLK